jgi:hypothetical protein
MLLTKPYPGCCTARIISGFGGTMTAEINRLATPSYDLLHKEISYQQRYLKGAGFAVVSATLNSDQKVADKVLRDLGWKYSRWITKRNHSDKKLRIYYKDLSEVV